MIRFIGRRLLWTIPTLFLITFLVFIAIRIGTDPVQSYLRINPRASQAKIAQYKRVNGLNGNIVSQYFNWLHHFITFDWGRSIKGSRPVWPELKAAMANTVVLGTLATAVGLIFGLAIGIVSAMRPRSLFDQTSTTTAFVGISIPPYVSAILLQLFFAITLTRWLGLSKPLLPTSGIYPPGHKGFNLMLRIKYLILPITVVAIQIIAVYSRYMRASLLEVKNSDYLRTARAKGVSERRILVRHALRNALIPIVTVAAIDIGGIIGGLIITERIFQNKGMGDFFLTAYTNGDFPQLMPWMVFVVLAVIFANLLADVLYAVLDPRIRLD
ncbi:MAG: peptide/nickel transport system permease protein [Ilumatobacteraceae bacterium]|jgi:peptide/nickel transport system permease protein